MAKIFTLINVWDTGIQKAMDYLTYHYQVRVEKILFAIAHRYQSYPVGFNSVLWIPGSENENVMQIFDFFI
jgi:hypothetical protein